MMPPLKDQDRRNRAIGMQVMGVLLLSIGLGLLHVWIGLAAAGIGLVLMGVAQELG